MGVCQTELEEVPVDAVGRRVSCGGERATVRYVGPVPPTDGKIGGLKPTHTETGRNYTLGGEGREGQPRRFVAEHNRF